MFRLICVVVGVSIGYIVAPETGGPVFGLILGLMIAELGEL